MGRESLHTQPGSEPSEGGRKGGREGGREEDSWDALAQG